MAVPWLWCTLRTVPGNCCDKPMAVALTIVVGAMPEELAADWVIGWLESVKASRALTA